MTQSIHLARFIEQMLNGDDFDAPIEGFTTKDREGLISAGDNIEDVMTSTLDMLAQRGDVKIRDLDITAVRALIERLRFWEPLVSALEVIHRMARDQELVLEDNLQRVANHVSKELKHYEGKPMIEQDFKDLHAYMRRTVTSRRRNQRLIDRALEAAEAAKAAEAAQAPPKP